MSVITYSKKIGYEGDIQPLGDVELKDGFVFEMGGMLLR